MGASRSSWGAVAPTVAARTTAVVYDRSGLGRSPADPAPRTLSRLAGDLVDVLARLGLIRPAVNRLAAHLPEPAATAMRAEDGTVAAVRTHHAELTSHVDDLRRLRDETPALPDVPVTVISGLVPSRIERRRRPDLVEVSGRAVGRGR